MAILPRQSSSYEAFDDQADALMKTYKGNWTHYLYPGFFNNTFTATPNPGASFSFTFSGSEAYLYGGVLNITDDDGDMFTLSWPTADYSIDGTPSGSQKPHWDYGNTSIIYFQTPQLANGTHTIDVTVTMANDTNLFIIDYFLVVPTAGDNSGVQTTRNAPAPTSSTPTVVSQAVPVGPIVGGVVGGIAAIAILVILGWYFLFRRSRGGRAYYFEKPGAADVLAGEDHVEPFNSAPPTATSPPPSSTGFGRPGPQSAYSDSSSAQPLNQSFGQRASVQPSQFSQSGPSEGGVTFVSSSSTQPRTGKAALIAQQHANVQEPVQYQDSGVRFNGGEDQEPGPSQLPVDVPPTYTPN